MAKRKTAATAAPAGDGYNVAVTITITKGTKLISEPTVPMYDVPYSDVVGIQRAVSNALTGLGEAKIADAAAK